MTIDFVLNRIKEDALLPTFEHLYGCDEETLNIQKKRYINTVRKFGEIYPTRKDIRIFSASGRTEIGGNHTDHQNGCILAATVSLDIIAVVALHEEGVIRVSSEGYRQFEVDLSNLELAEKRNTSKSIVQGIAARFIEKGFAVGGMDIYCVSDVPNGSGISSSAAFETVIGTVIDMCWNNNRAGAEEIAKIGQYAENVYFGKKCGLMDQLVSSVGGIVAVDFRDVNMPVIKNFNYNFEKNGYSICITDTRSTHVNFTDDYDSVRNEMEQVAVCFGEKNLRNISVDDIMKSMPKLRKTCSDRAILRSIHFVEDNQRAQDEAKALINGDIDLFLKLVNESGESSANHLQNLYSVSSPLYQEIPLAIAASKKILGGKGAVRVHGGGFGGTIQAFVPNELTAKYITKMNKVFGNNACQKMRVRPVGGIEITFGGE